jgi:hypothetical protein
MVEFHAPFLTAKRSEAQSRNPKRAFEQCEWIKNPVSVYVLFWTYTETPWGGAAMRNNIREFAGYLFTMEPSDPTPWPDMPSFSGPRARRAAGLFKTLFWMGMSVVFSVGVSQLH